MYYNTTPKMIGNKFTTTSYVEPPITNGYVEQSSGDRFIGGGFVGPFILGGITGGLLAPSFNPRPYPYPYPVPVPPQRPPYPGYFY